MGAPYREELAAMNSIAQNVSPKELAGETARLSLNDRLALISLMEGGTRVAASDAPMTADLFENLSGLVDETVSGAKIDRLRSDRSNQGFKIFEINSDTGENLGRLNMLYLNKPIPCYYLVYVEVAAPFRNKGLGNLVLKVFKDFLVQKAAVGILDNIIPGDDPTYDVYLKLNWKPIESLTQTPVSATDGQYMIFVPPGLAARDLKDPILKLLHHIKRKRPVIDMRDNELMVKRTIEEFKDLYSALLIYFEKEISTDQDTSLMRFMFTRFVTKLLGFRRRIGRLLGYTGGESLEQIVLSPQISSLRVQSYAPRELTGKPFFECGDKELWLNLPEVLKKHPARDYRGSSELPEAQPRRLDGVRRCLLDRHPNDRGLDGFRIRSHAAQRNQYWGRRVHFREDPTAAVESCPQYQQLVQTTRFRDERRHG